MNIIEEVKKLELPFGEYLVIGSGILGALGIREVKDIDLVVTPKLFDKLKNKGWQLEEIEIQGKMRHRLVIGLAEAYADFYLYDEPQNIYKMIEEAEIIQDVPFMKLEILLEMKRSLNRQKDLDDIELINEYVGGQNNLYIIM